MTRFRIAAHHRDRRKGLYKNLKYVRVKYTFSDKFKRYIKKSRANLTVSPTNY